MNVARLIARHKTGTYTVTRTSPRASTNGRLIAPVTSTFPIDAHVQTLTGRALETLPEGRSANESRVVWSTTELRTTGAGQEPDMLTIEGTLYVVINVEKWSDRGTTFYRALVSIAWNTDPAP